MFVERLSRGGGVFKVLVTVYLALASSTICRADDGSLTKAVDEVKVARNELFKLPVHQLETDVSTVAMSAVLRMRKALEGLVVEYLKTVSAQSTPDVKKIEENLNSLINAQRILPGISSPKVGGEDLYGYETYFEVKTTQDERRLLQIKGAFSIPCGEDSLLLIFQPDNQHWREILNWQTPKYNSVSGSLNNFNHVISPSDASGNWYVLGSDSPTWCSSCWGSLQYYVLRPKENDTRPTVSFKDSSTFYRCTDDEWDFSLLANSNDFELHFPGQSIDSVNLIRPHVRHYDIEGDQIARTQPVAETPGDFVDEWIDSPWEEASQWCEEKDCKSIKAEHELLQNFNKTKELSFGVISKYRDASDIVQVELLHDGKRSRDTLRYFLIRSGKEFTLFKIERSSE